MWRALSYAFVAAAIHVCAALPPAMAAKTVALVVGIDTYDNVGGLTKATADATAVARVLSEDLKLPSVKLLKDARRGEILSEWRKALGKLENGDVLFFFFAGHGVELRGQNFLAPRDAAFDETNQTSFREVAIEVQGLLSDLSEIQKTKDVTAIFILDACRENPFLPKAPVATPTGRPRAGLNAVGLAPPLAGLPKNVFMMYSAGIGQKAADGGGSGPNSIFTSRLLPLLAQREPKLALSDLAQSLRFGVYEEALKYVDEQNQRIYQTPAYYDQLLQRLTILGDTAEPVRLSVPTGSVVGARVAVRAMRGGDVLVECQECPELVMLPEAPGSARRLAMGKFEVTRREWRACADAGRCAPLRTTRTITGEPQQDRDPVTGVTWHEIKTYLDWLSDVTKQRYRLPSGAEWDYAARAGASDAKLPLRDGETVCTYGNTADRSLGSVIWADLSCSDQVGRTVTNVGRYRPNAWGIHDMIGNAWEWTSDCQRAGAGDACTRYIAKGGSWRTDMHSLRMDVETAVPASQRRSTLGFRVVREVEG